MSSYYTTVSCAEWQRMREAIQAADSYVLRNNEEIARLKELEAQRKQELYRVQQENGRAIERALDVLNTAYRVATAETEERSLAHTTMQDSEFGTQLKDLRQQASKLSDQTKSALTLAENLAKRYSDAFSVLVAELPKDEARAKKILGELDALLERIRTLHPEIFAPAEYTSLETLRTALSANVASGDFQAAVIVSQNSILNASQLLTQLVVENEQYGIRAAEVEKDAEALQSRLDLISAKGGILSIELGEEQLEHDYDIRFWSSGRFDEIDAHTQEVAKQIKEAIQAPVGKRALDSLAQVITKLDLQLSSCDAKARNALAGAIAVEHAAQRLYSSLDERGWTLESSGRQDEDSRKPYAMTYEDRTGNTVSVIIASGDQPERPAFFYEAFAESEGMAAIVKDGVSAALQEEGFVSGEIVQQSDCVENTAPNAFIERTVQEVAQRVMEREKRGSQNQVI